MALNLPTVERRMFSKRPCRILIIEDDRDDCEIYKRSLELSRDWKFEFAESATAVAGIEAARSWCPDCILLDYNLPDMDGLEVLAKLNGLDAQHPFPVVMLTAYGGESLAVQAMKAGAMDYLPKRQAGGDLLSAVVKAIRGSQMQRQIEEQRCALENGARRYQVLLEAIPQMVWTVNSNGVIEYANWRWFEYTGFVPQGQAQLGWDRCLHPEDLERTRSAWNKAVESNSIFEIEHRLKRSDGSYRWHLVRAVPLQYGVGEDTHWFGTCTEIEDQKQAEKSLMQNQKLESVGLLAGGIAHDFNNLLVTILGGASIAMDRLPRSHPAQGMLQSVVCAGEQAAQLTRQLLAYAGKANLFVEKIDMGQLVQQTCERIRSSLPQTIQLELQNGPDLPPVQTDLAQMRQAITDLVVNAVEAVGEGAGTVCVCTEVVDIDEESAQRNGIEPQRLNAGKHVALEVCDTGCGMDEETRRRIFDPFFSTKSAGRGLGLAGVQGFVRSNGGGIQVDSAPGEGTRFRMLLPAVSETNGTQSARP